MHRLLPTDVVSYGLVCLHLAFFLFYDRHQTKNTNERTNPKTDHIWFERLNDAVRLTCTYFRLPPPHYVFLKLDQSNSEISPKLYIEKQFVLRVDTTTKFNWLFYFLITWYFSSLLSHSLPLLSCFVIIRYSLIENVIDIYWFETLCSYTKTRIKDRTIQLIQPMLPIKHWRNLLSLIFELFCIVYIWLWCFISWYIYLVLMKYFFSFFLSLIHSHLLTHSHTNERPIAPMKPGNSGNNNLLFSNVFRL